MFGCFHDFGFVSGLLPPQTNGRMFTQENEGLGNRMISGEPHGWRHGFGLHALPAWRLLDGCVRRDGSVAAVMLTVALSLLMDAGWALTVFRFSMAFRHGAQSCLHVCMSPLTWVEITRGSS